MTSDPKLIEAVRIVREEVIPGAIEWADELEAVLAALEAAGAWQADRAAVCADRERLSAQLAEAQREPYRLLWKALEDAGVTRGDGCPDTILWEEIHKGRRAEATLAEVQAQLRQAEILGDQAEQELEKAERERDEARAEAFDATHAFAASVREAEALHAEVERLRETGRVHVKRWIALLKRTEQAEDEATFLRGQYNEAEEKRGRAEAEIMRSHKAILALTGEVERLRAQFLPQIASYFGSGGLFNPEMMEHDKVRDFLIDLRAALAPEVK